jgi:hypothetical protein
MTAPAPDVAEIGRKLDALSVIFRAPPGPYREHLSATGQALLDGIEAGGKGCALALADERFDDAFRTLGVWSSLFQSFIDATLVNDPDPRKAEANRRLCAVYRYWCRAPGVDWGEVTR